jgi:hypothetical protein
MTKYLQCTVDAYSIIGALYLQSMELWTSAHVLTLRNQTHYLVIIVLKNELLLDMILLLRGSSEVEQ